MGKSATPAKPATPAAGYDMARPQGQCMLCGKPIAPDDKYMAALRETPAGFERVDVGLDCWEGFDRANVLGFWRTTMPRTQQKKKVFVDDDVLCELFERLESAVEPGKLSFRFVLGLILMRKRMLIYESSRKEGENADREIWSMRFKGREQTMDMLNPRLTEEQVLDVSRQLGESLNAEL
jgi:hypothetical protein